MKILNFGSMNIDYVYSLDHIVAPGETENSSQLSKFAGGKGLNQSIALARAGAQVYHAGFIGADGQLLLKELTDSAVNTTFIEENGSTSGHAIIQLAKSGQNSIFLYGGANRQITKAYIDNVLQNFEKGDMLLLQNEINMIDYIIEAAAKRKMQIALNPSPFDDAVKKCSLDLVDIFLLNEIEGEQLSGQKEPKAILQKMQQLYPAAAIVLTLGADGSFYCKENTYLHQSAHKANVVDTTAAGDTFTGYFLAGLLSQKTPQESMELAAKAAALAVSVKGASVSIPCL